MVEWWSGGVVEWWSGGVVESGVRGGRGPISGELARAVNDHEGAAELGVGGRGLGDDDEEIQKGIVEDVAKGLVFGGDGAFLVMIDNETRRPIKQLAEGPWGGEVIGDEEGVIANPFGEGGLAGMGGTIDPVEEAGPGLVGGFGGGRGFGGGLLGDLGDVGDLVGGVGGGGHGFFGERSGGVGEGWSGGVVE